MFRGSDAGDNCGADATTTYSNVPGRSRPSNFGSLGVVSVLFLADCCSSAGQRMEYFERVVLRFTEGSAIVSTILAGRYRAQAYPIGPTGYSFQSFQAFLT
jgi:hypothetical protein